MLCAVCDVWYVLSVVCGGVCMWSDVCNVWVRCMLINKINCYIITKICKKKLLLFLIIYVRLQERALTGQCIEVYYSLLLLKMKL